MAVLSIITSESPIIYNGAERICRVAGLNHKKFGYYIKQMNLPVYKVDESCKTWLIDHDDLVAWLADRKKKWREKL